jgi:hypothetical protein
MLAHLSLSGVKWLRVKRHALRNWTRCADGRLHHPVVAEIVLEAWIAKLEQRLSGGVGNAKRWGTVFDRSAIEARIDDARRRLAALNPDSKVLARRRQSSRDESGPESGTETPPDSPPDSGLASPPESGHGRKRERSEVKREESETPPPTPSASQAPQGQTLLPAAPRPARRVNGDGDPETLTGGVWAAYAEAYEQRYRIQPIRDAQMNAKLAAFVKRVGREDAPHIARFYLTHDGRQYVQRQHPVGFLLSDCEGLRTQWAQGRTVTESEARAADKTAARGNVFGELIEEADRHGAH